MNERKWTTHPKNGRKVMEGNVCVAIAQSTPARPPQAWINARLIAAAPELLAACEAVEHNLRQRAFGQEDVDVLRAAIAKAKRGDATPTQEAGR